jgi:hypothetical protein
VLDFPGIPAFFFDGAGRDRTDDLLHAMQALSQLSYSPTSDIIIIEFPMTVNSIMRNSGESPFTDYINFLSGENLEG